MKWEDWYSVREVKTVSFWRDIFSEFLVSSFLLLYVTLSMVVLDSSIYHVDMVYIGILVGFLVFVLIEGYGPVSSFMNPSTCLAQCLVGRISIVRALISMLSESAGGIAGSFLVYQVVVVGLVYRLTPDQLKSQIHPFVPSNLITPWQGMIVEMILSFNLLYITLSSTDNRTHDVILPSLTISFTIGIGIMAAVSVYLLLSMEIL
ncbi:hypothetical protein LSH36_11g11003 [Paralvinella palmiformis]|uniref:Aquaporin n=1 Tax=Paralvinella palmiformis TaxID=53620 RepID=A0AAD9KEM0_9ANNE|nr:hypothetical protein LSH36_11g11003 [Paralvinella palmiformis]